MRFHERDDGESGRDREQESEGDGVPGRRLEELGGAASDFLSVADEAIRRALSADSQEFLLANVQRGGQ